MHAQKTQTKPQTTNTFHNGPTQLAREEVPREAISVNLGEGRILGRAQADRNTGEDLVPEQTRQDETVARIGDGTDKDHVDATVAQTLWHSPFAASRDVASQPCGHIPWVAITVNKHFTIFLKY